MHIPMQPVKEAPPEEVELSIGSTGVDPMLKHAAAAPVDPFAEAKEALDTDKKPSPPTDQANQGQAQLIPKKEKSYVGMAISATVIIVIALAALAVYAYTKKQ
jgi:hypothetical protein